MRKSIKIDPESRKKLEETFGVTQQFVWYALNYVKNGPSSERIRQAALDLGGIYVTERYVPNCRTVFTADEIVQDYGATVILIVNRRSGDLSISEDGEVVETVKGADLYGWAAMAEKAQEMAIARIVRN